MEPEKFDMASYKKAENIRITTGIIAIAVAALYLLPPAFLSPHYFSISYLRIGWSDFIIIAAMIAFAIYVFVFFGKKKSPLLGISAILAAVFIIFASVRIILIMSGYGLRLPPSTVRTLIFRIIIGIIIVILAIHYFKRITLIAKLLPIVAFALTIFFPTGLSGFNLMVFELSFIRILSSLYLIPFLLFGFFCPLSHKRIVIDASPVSIQKQDEDFSGEDSF